MVGQPPSPPTQQEEQSGEPNVADPIEAETEVAAAASTRIEEPPAPSAASEASVWSSLFGVLDSTMKLAAYSSPVRRLQSIMGYRGTTGVQPGSTIWLLGVAYKLTTDDQAASTRVLEEFMQDFTSRIWMTYRRGFEAIGNSKHTTDQGWGCMIRSGQMLCAQALLCHHLGRSWRKGDQPFAREYVEILRSFGDDPAEPFSIHNFIAAGSSFGVAAGSWLGPYGLCRTVEAIASGYRQARSEGRTVAPMAVYVVSGDGQGNSGGAPSLCKEDVAEMCTTWDDSVEWSPVVILVPLVLGPDKVNPRYLPSVRETFTFPQSLGISGGKHAASTYLIGVQDDQVIYLDPHEVQKVVSICADDGNVDTSSYHCGEVRRMALDAIDNSLALGFYCRNREEFDDLCARASALASESKGAPMFTVVEHRGSTSALAADADFHVDDGDENERQSQRNDGLSEEEWQFL